MEGSPGRSQLPVHEEVRRKRLACLAPGLLRSARPDRPDPPVVPFGKPEGGGNVRSNVVEITCRLRPWWHDGGGGEATPGAMSIFAYVPRFPAARSACDAGSQACDAGRVLLGGGDAGSQAGDAASQAGDAASQAGDSCSQGGNDAGSQACNGACSVFGADPRHDVEGGLAGGSTMAVHPPGATLDDIASRGCTLWAPHEGGGQRFLLPPGHMPVPHFLGGQVVESIGISYWYLDGEDVFYRESPPAFENVCGGISMASSSHISEVVASVEAEGRSGGCNILKRSRTAFGLCFEMFTIYGNITLRRDRNAGGTVSFKGARDVRKIFGVLQEGLGREFVESCEAFRNQAQPHQPAPREPSAGRRRPRRPRARVVVSSADGARRIERALPPPPQRAYVGYPGFFGVHMAVVTACLGRRLSLSPGNSLEMHVVRVLGTQGVLIVPSLNPVIVWVFIE